MTIRRAVLMLSLSLGGCATPRPPAAPVQPSLAWRAAATSEDRERLRDWHATFRRAVLAANRSARDEEVAREGVLLQPDAALVGGPIPNGDYRCRVIKLGGKSEGHLDFVAYPYFRCRIAPSGGLQSFVKLTGSQRYVGRIYPGDALRQVFLGTLVLGDERQAMAYGMDSERNVAGHVERIGPARWRLVMPRPHFESQLDVLELVPVS
jgi:hypothetical protein